MINKIKPFEYLHKTLALLLLAVLIIFSLSSIANHRALAASGTDGISITSPASAYHVGDTFTVTVTDNGSGTISSINAVINYNSSLLSTSSANIAIGSSAGSPLTQSFGVSVTGGKITIAGGLPLSTPPTGVTGPLTIAKITFQVLGAGSTSLSVDNSSAIYLLGTNFDSFNGNTSPLNLTLSVQTCPSGYTGTYPNCTAPGCPSGQVGTPPSCKAPSPSPTCLSQGKAGTYPNCVASAASTSSPATNNTSTPNGVAIPNSTGPGANTSPSQSSNSSSNGSVINSYANSYSSIIIKVLSGGKPVSKATVTLSNQKQITNSSGIANFNAIPGAYTIKITGKGIKSYSNKIIVQAFNSGQQLTANVSSNGSPLILAFIIIITIILIGAVVYLLVKNKEMIMNFIPKAHKTTQIASTVDKPNIIVPATNLTKTVSPAIAIHPSIIAPSISTATLTGKITNSLGRPIAGAVVRYGKNALDNGNGGFSVTSNADGSYLITGLTPNCQYYYYFSSIGCTTLQVINSYPAGVSTLNETLK